MYNIKNEVPLKITQILFKTNFVTEGFTVTPVNDDIYNWNVKLNKIRQDVPLAVDLVMLDEIYQYVLPQSLFLLLLLLLLL